MQAIWEGVLRRPLRSSLAAEPGSAEVQRSFARRHHEESSSLTAGSALSTLDAALRASLSVLKLDIRKS